LQRKSSLGLKPLHPGGVDARRIVSLLTAIFCGAAKVK
jgi:hypothetical protein